MMNGKIISDGETLLRLFREEQRKRDNIGCYCDYCIVDMANAYARFKKPKPLRCDFWQDGQCTNRHTIGIKCDAVAGTKIPLRCSWNRFIPEPKPESGKSEVKK
jgi:hypothetical protein